MVWWAWLARLCCWPLSRSPPTRASSAHLHAVTEPHRFSHGYTDAITDSDSVADAERISDAEPHREQHRDAIFYSDREPNRDAQPDGVAQ